MIVVSKICNINNGAHKVLIYHSAYLAQKDDDC